MSQLTLSTLLHQIGSDKVTGFFLVLARVSPLFVLAPMFSSKMMPVRVKGIVAVGLSIGLTPLAVQGQTIPSDPMAVAGMLVVQVLVGLAFAFAVGMVLAAVEAAGAITDMVAGFSFGSVVDPINGNQGGTMTNLYSLVGLAMFIAIGGDAWTLRGLQRTFDLVPLTKAAPIASLTSGVEQAFATIFVSAVEVCAPVILALMITDVAFGMIAKVVPQVNIFGVGFPMKVGVAMLVVAASLPFLGTFMSNQVSSSVLGILHFI
jgi:flagellar biosynthetic protein FliR